MKRYMIFDIGGTAVKYACSDGEGRFLKEGAFATPEDFDGMIAEMKKAHQVCLESGEWGRKHGMTALGESGEQGWEAAGIALSLPGAVHASEGVVRGISAVTYLHHRPLREEISRSFGGLPVSMENDACCAALGELWKGAGRGKHNLVFVVCGTGIGGAVIVDGKLYQGNDCQSGEFGNVLFKKEDGGWCKWGSCTMVHQALKYGELTHTAVDGKELLSRARRQDKTAGGLVEEFLEAMAVGIYNIQFAFDPEAVILGGGVSESPLVIPGICEKINQLAEGRDFACIRPVVLRAEHGNRANLLGALRRHLELF